jgi:branched-chain amino acid transport system ATP-binding protein
MNTDIILEKRNLVKELKGFVAVDSVSLRVKMGSRHVLIGPDCGRVY